MSVHSHIPALDTAANQSAYLNRIHQTMSNKDYDTAREFIGTALGQLPNSIPFLRAALAWATATKQYPAARQLAERAYAIQPENPLVAASLAKLYAFDDRRPEARNILRSVDRHIKASAEATTIAVEAHLKLGHVDAARRLLDQASFTSAAGKLIHARLKARAEAASADLERA